jgi:hypothetical protein
MFKKVFNRRQRGFIAGPFASSISPSRPTFSCKSQRCASKDGQAHIALCRYFSDVAVITIYMTERKLHIV